MRSPEKIAVGVITTIGVAYLIQQGVAGEQQRQQVQPNLRGIWTEAGGAANISGALPAEKPVPDFANKVHELLEAHAGEFRAAGKTPMIVITESVRIKVKEPLGIFVRDLPDQDLGKQIPTGMNEPYLKALQVGSDQGVFNRFVVVQNENTNEISIWTVRQGDQGPEFFALYHQGQDLVELTSENSVTFGEPLSVQDLVGRFLPKQTPAGKTGS